MAGKGGYRIQFVRFRQTVDSEVRPMVENIVEKFARDIANVAAVKAPYRYGFLSASIQPARMGVLEWRVNVGMDYGIYQEYGTRRMAARPFLTPALNDHKMPFLAAIQSAVTK